MLKQRHRSPPIITAEDLAHEPISIGGNSTIYDAIEKILGCNISVVLVRAGQTYGILSQKDIAETLLFEERNAKKIPAVEKAQDLTLVDRYAPVPNCASLMLSKKTNALGIRGNDGASGIFTKHDLVRYYYENVTEQVKLADVMTVGSFFVPQSTSIYDALKKMTDNHISRLLVKDDAGKPAGIVTFKSFLSRTLYESNRYDDDVFSSGFGTRCTVSDIMTRNIVTVSMQTSLSRVAKILLEYRIHGVAVTSGQKIAGFVTEKDIVRQIARIEIQ